MGTRHLTRSTPAPIGDPVRVSGAPASRVAPAQSRRGHRLAANDPAPGTPHPTAVERPEPASVQQYTGPRTADAAEAWIESRTAYTGPRTADAAAAWLQSAPAQTGPTAPAAIEAVSAHPAGALQCLVTADAAEHWVRATGHLPCQP
jgi:hypothetical protein